MKNLFSKLLLLTLSSILLWGCEKDENMVKVQAGIPATLTTSASTIVLAKPNLTQAAVTFSFTAADFGYDASVKNTIQMAKNGANFSSGVKEFNLDPGVLSKTFTVQEFNALMMQMGLTPDVSTTLNVRVKSSVSSSVAETYSGVANIAVTPFALEEFIYLPGSYQGWDPGTAESLVSATGNGIYVGTIQFDSSESPFKILKGRGWGQGQYGGGATAGTITPDDGSGSNIVGPVFTNSYYLKENYEVTVDLNANTIAYALNTWGVIGDATAGGWDNDTIMKYNNTTKKWSITIDLLGGKKIKFRKNHNWGTNYGYNGTVGTLGGDDIPISADGNYTITVDFVAGTYTAVKNN